MSERITVKSTYTNHDLVAKTCKQLNLPAPIYGKTALYDNVQIEGLQVKLAGWNYPVVINNDGSSVYDNYKGAWGDEAKLHEFRNQYVENAVCEAATHAGYAVEDRYETEDSITLMLTA